MTQPTLLILDDDCVFARAAGQLAMEEGFQVQLAHTLRDARAFARRQRIDLMLLDLDLPDGSGLDLMDEVDLTWHGQVAVVTGKPSLETAVRAVASPIIDYLLKPLRPDLLQGLMRRTMQRWIAPAGRSGPASARLAGNSPGMRHVAETVLRVAASDAPVLLTGETGTGKALAARAIHDASGRGGPFVVLDCGSVRIDGPRTPLFGDAPGWPEGIGSSAFEGAAGGTLLLADIDELASPLQSQLLRTMESGAADGENRPSSPRLLFTFTGDPLQRVADGSLREDLYYAMSGLTLALPPLRLRGDDVVLLADLFIRRLNARYGQEKRLAPGADRELLRHPWPGNVRELHGAVQRAYVLQRTDRLHIQPTARACAPEAGGASSLVFPVGTPLADIERRAVEATLDHFGQDKAAAARALGISVRTIYNHLARRAGEGRDR